VHALGPGERIEDCPYAKALAMVPASRLASHSLVITESAARLAHARGHSLPDWVALRYGVLDSFPDGVAYPASDDDVRALLDYAVRQDASLIPYGGGTSVVGHIHPLAGDRPVLTVDLSRLNRLIDLDEVSRLATFEAGVRGPILETALAGRGFTLGHFPQSFEASTLGGWVATRSTGQQSHHYGRIEQLFAGGHLETPAGPLDLPAVPASAAGPDLRQLVLGSEGRLGILTRAVVRVRRRPTFERFSAFFFHDWREGAEAVRRCAQAGAQASMLRLSDSVETETTLRLAGHPTMAAWARRGLSLLGYSDSSCLLVAAETDQRAGLHRLGGLPAGRPIGSLWRASRFRAPYLRNTLWEAGYALDTLETAVPWSRVGPCAGAILAALRAALEDEGERVLAFVHLSHAYPDGASIYATLLFRRTRDPDQTLARWRALKESATAALLLHGGTVSHQHGVGLDHAPFLSLEKGPLGLRTLQAACRTLDPRGVMNPKKLVA
jgi:alkyldihydroxyacetonephosphate synthase